MKKSALLILALILLPVLNFAKGYRIKVVYTRLRSRPNAFSRTKAKLRFNTWVNVIKKKGFFYYVSSKYGRGYITKTAVIGSNKFKSRYKNVRSGSTGRDGVTAATKGFTKAETQYRNNSGRRARYDLVNKVMRQYSFETEEAGWTRFRKKGYLGEYRKMKRNRYYR